MIMDRTLKSTAAAALIVCDDRLREINLGTWEGRIIEEMAVECPEEFAQFASGKPDAVFADGENFAGLHQRFIEALEAVARKHSGKTVTIFSHGMALACALCAFNGVELNGRTYKQKNACLNVVDYENGKWQIMLQNYSPYYETDSLKYMI
ncbi:MAG: histidine phosphatase family protein [Negativicutes bacterium]|jgi:probable phosphoglycerate mutase